MVLLPSRSWRKWKLRRISGLVVWGWQGWHSMMEWSEGSLECLSGAGRCHIWGGTWAPAGRWCQTWTGQRQLQLLWSLCWLSQLPAWISKAEPDVAAVEGCRLLEKRNLAAKSTWTTRNIAFPWPGEEWGVGRVVSWAECFDHLLTSSSCGNIPNLSQRWGWKVSSAPHVGHGLFCLSGWSPWWNQIWKLQGGCVWAQKDEVYFVP